MIKRGKASRPEYNCWRAMITRCTDPKYVEFFRYGGAGITVCEEWISSFDAFVSHIGPRPSLLHTIDRIDNAKGYRPGNVRWATKAEQSQNRGMTTWVEINGETRCLSEWCSYFGISITTAFCRIGRGWSPSRAVSEPSKGRVHSSSKFTDFQVADIRRRASGGASCGALAKEFNVNKTTMYNLVKGRSFKHVVMEART